MERLKKFVRELGEFFLFAAEACRHIPYNLAYPAQTLHNIYSIGFKSLPVIVLTGFFSGMILGLELASTLDNIIAGTSQFIGAGLSVTLLKEFGPVLTSLILVSRVSSSETAHIGTMRVTEQIDALLTFAVNPVRFLASPRIIAAMISAPLLGLMSIFAAMMGGWLMTSGVFGVESSVFWEYAQSYAKLRYVLEAVVKLSVIGGFVIAVSVWCGFNTRGGASGVGEATIKSVVTGSFLVILLDYGIGTLFILFTGGAL